MARRISHKRKIGNSLALILVWVALHLFWRPPALAEALIAAGVAIIIIAILAQGRWRWPEGLAFVLAAAVLIWLAQITSVILPRPWSATSAPQTDGGPATPAAAPVGLLPLPAARLVGGTGRLAAGQPIDLYAALTNAAGTPAPALVSYAEVVELRSKEGVIASASRSDVEVVLVNVPQAALPTVQAILLQKDTPLAYTLLLGTATATPNPTATPAPSPTLLPTATAEPGYVYLTLPTAKIASGAELVMTGAHKLVIVPGGLPGATPAPGALPPAQETCVEVVSFLDKNNARQGIFDKDDTAQVLVSLRNTALIAAAPALARVESLWLIPQTDCKP